MKDYTEGQKTAKRRWYEQNTDYVKTKAAERSKEIIKWFQEYKDTLSCQTCGFSHPAALQFHHRDAKTKEIDVAVAVRNGWSKKRIMVEIEKCDVLCANCHFIHHYCARMA